MLSSVTIFQKAQSHTAPTILQRLHKELQNIKPTKCTANTSSKICKYMQMSLHTCTMCILSTQCPTGQPRCKQMDDAFLTSCKTALSNLLSSARIKESDDPFAAFSSAVMNFYSHYCLDEYSSECCHHEKVCNVFQKKHIMSK